jgi:hypothetical protein
MADAATITQMLQAIAEQVNDRTFRSYIAMAVRRLELIEHHKAKRPL